MAGSSLLSSIQRVFEDKAKGKIKTFLKVQLQSYAFWHPDS